MQKSFPSLVRLVSNFSIQHSAFSLLHSRGSFSSTISQSAWNKTFCAS